MPRLVESTEDGIAEAVRVLRDGLVVAFPTETVYGLGADTFNVRALERVYELKGRPARNPLIAHVAGREQARRVVARWDERCDDLAARFWPGPLTLVLPRGADVPERATAGWPTIAVRAPAHPVARRLLGAFCGSISAPSANRSGHVSPTTARHVADDFADAAKLVILEGGACAIGIESTVVDLSGDVPQVLRPGAVTVDELREAVGEVALTEIATQAASPGTAGKHYAPNTAAELVPGASLRGRLDAIREPAVVLCFQGTHVPAPHRSIVMPAGPQAYAARLYDALREADGMDAGRIVIEEPAGRTGLWLAIRDRLWRATGPEEGAQGRRGAGAQAKDSRPEPSDRA
ncbi:MAG: L-threonylcarbamoyladenylate synthase [Planctomycetota bacterium]|jgi:L-threonylcarbamoyladenylate synthase